LNAGLPDFSLNKLPKWRKIYQMNAKCTQYVAVKYTKLPQKIPNEREIYQHFLRPGPPKYAQIFGLKIYHLASEPTLKRRPISGHSVEHAGGVCSGQEKYKACKKACQFPSLDVNRFISLVCT
jgi:hypothetical protein